VSAWFCLGRSYILSRTACSIAKTLVLEMGCTSSQTQSPDEVARIQVDAEFIKQHMNELFTFKILLLGAGESGKSTILKQFRLMHNQKPKKHELDTIADALHQNIIDCMKALIGAAAAFQYELEDELDRRTALMITEHEENHRISGELAKAIVKLYDSEPIQKAYARRAEFWILDACEYYMSNIMRFAVPDFEPSEEDSIRARVRTTGIVVTNIEHKLPQPKEDEPDVVNFEVVDVGGQRSERRKWIHCFDNVKAILFVVNLNAYNQVLFEDTKKNRLIESLELFHEISHRANFANTPIFLFLNKKDLFEKVIAQVDLAAVKDPATGDLLFGDYTGGNNVLKGIDYIINRFNKELPEGKAVHIEVVTGVLRLEVKRAFEDVKKVLVDSNRSKVRQERAQLAKQVKNLGKKGVCGSCCGGCGCESNGCSCSCGGCRAACC